MTKHLRPLTLALRCLALATVASCSLLLAQDADPEEAFGTGLVFDVEAYRSVPYKAPVTAETYADLPKSVSLEKYCPTPGDQGPHSTCTGFAAAYHLRTILYAIENQMTNRRQIDDAIFSPTFVYEKIRDPEGDPNCKKGTSPVAALELMRSVGVAPLDAVPYLCGAGIDSDDLLIATEFPIVDYQILYTTNLPENDPIKVLSVKKALSEGSPVLICFKVHKSFYRASEVWRQQATDAGPEGQHGLHAMVAVGYDDNRYGGAVRVINSWGTKEWGDRGFVWIPYDDFARNCIGALQAYGKQPKPKPYQKSVPVTPETPLLLAGSVEFEERDGTEMPAIKIVKDGVNASGQHFEGYRLARAYPSGTRFRFYVNTNSRAYLYAFATDLTGKITQILPFEDGMSPMIGKGSTIAFPSEKKVVRMDNVPGTDYLLMLYSDEPLDPKALAEAIEANEGTLSVKVHQALGPRLIQQEHIKYADDGIGFAIQQQTRGHVVPLMVEIVHD
ncbi:DUF4384 domain-containing protein [Cerasicoccus fimbriatus]|uniref:DUF4384 domain-containing protein n=1 Tax=Cerasicoccus fimbriatus TaxID=3014554 RepID=UPI0022B2EB4D|nr:DUF4384 domain-containing protein [Cerasicoccus sp. TK19100]